MKTNHPAPTPIERDEFFFPWMEERNWLTTRSYLPPGADNFAELEWLGRAYAFSRRTHTRMLARLIDPSGPGYELWFSFDSPEHREEFKELLKLDGYADPTDPDVWRTPPDWPLQDWGELSSLAPLGNVLPASYTKRILRTASQLLEALNAPRRTHLLAPQKKEKTLMPKKLERSSFRFESPWMEGQHWLVIPVALPDDDDESAEEQYAELGAILAAAFSAACRVLARLDDPEGPMYEFWISTDTKQNEAKLCRLLGRRFSAADREYWESTLIEPELLEDVPSLRPLSEVFPPHALEGLMLAATRTKLY